MKRSRSTGKDLNIIDVNDTVIDIINMAREEYNEAKKMCKDIKFKDKGLLKHIKNSESKLDLIEKEAIKRNISNESMSYIEEIQDDFINKIYYDSDVDNSDDEMYLTDYEDGGITF